MTTPSFRLPTRLLTQNGQPRGPGKGSLGVPTAVAGGNNQGAQGVAATRTASGVEASYTTTTITFPANVKPRSVIVACSASSFQVQVPTAGNRVAAGAVQVNGDPLVLDVSGLPPGTSIGVQTEANGAAVVTITATYED